MVLDKIKKDNLENEDDEKIEEFSLLKEILNWIFIIVIASGIAFFINTFIIANSRVPSGSMENTIMTGDRLIGSRLSYKFDDPKRFDVVIFKWPDNEKIYFVKRIIGMPGDKVKISSGKVYLNDSKEPLIEDYIKEDMYIEEDMEFSVPENAYFMLGDNRNNSADSRRWNKPFVYKDKIVAKVIFEYFPRFKLIK